MIYAKTFPAHLLCARHVLDPGDVVAKKTVNVPCPQEREAINLRNEIVSVMGVGGGTLKGIERG